MKNINAKLTEEQKRVLFEKETEKPFSGKFLYDDSEGIYRCANCGNPLFSSETKYDSGNGWPSFTSPVSKESVDYRKDLNFGMSRTEVICKKCGGHLGHVFDDGPDNQEHYCINCLSLDKSKK